jgi:DNA-binding response OmpR family regulator/site-specific DNA-cytosine methylase
VSKRKLLLADDSITIQKVVNLTFADEGIEVIAVGDGDSAMRKFDEFMPDLVMADVNMPGLNGYEVCRIIKLTEETKHIPVILLVGSFEPFDEAEANDAGADDFLTKPFQSIRQLVNKVTDLLNQRASETPPGETAGEPQTVAPVDTFAETLEFEKQEEAAAAVEEAPAAVEYREEAPAEFGDAGMDDEMIETSPASGYASESDSGYQAETSVDYAKTQPLNSEDLKGFSIVPGTSAAQETGDAFENREAADENREAYTEAAEEAPGRAEPATFDEEARKLGGNQAYADSERREDSDTISENEPQIDYYLPAGDEDNKQEFEKEVTDAETLAPEVSYTSEQPREADLSQAEIVDESDTGPAAEETPYSTQETSYSSQETGTAAFDQAPADSESENQTAAESEEVRESYETETGSAEELRTGETAGTVEESEAESPESAESYSPEPAETEETEATPETRISAPANLSSMNFDEGDLLELPPLVEETGIRPQAVVQPPRSEPASETVAEPAAETVAEPEPETAETQTAGGFENMQSFPPELIEAIAQKVADKISAKTMNDVLPQITELVMKKMAEEKMKE